MPGLAPRSGGHLRPPPPPPSSGAAPVPAGTTPIAPTGHVPPVSLRPVSSSTAGGGGTVSAPPPATTPSTGSFTSKSGERRLLPKLGSRIAEKYLLDKELGRGGMGVVFRAVDTTVDRRVAIKVLGANATAERDRARFLREAEACGRLHHEGIVAIHEVGEHQQSPFIVMQYVDGLPLNELLKRERQTHRRMAEIVRDIARALAHAHDNGIIHRDIKPHNVMMEKDGRPRLMDFGLARVDTATEQLTKTGEMMGTPHYMAPEQVENRAPMTPATDVYALGGILYNGLTGQTPFTADSSLGIIKKVLMEDPTPPRRVDTTIPVVLDAVAMRCLEKDPADRFPSAHEVADTLDRWLAGEEVDVGRRSVLRRGVQKAMRTNRRLVFAVAGVAIAAVVVGLLAVVGLAYRRAAEAERVAVREAVSAFDAIYERARGGELAALDEAPAAIARLAELDVPDDELLDRKREVLDTLGRLAGGDDVLLRQIDFKSEPWLSHRRVVLEVLVARGEVRPIAVLLEREPTLLRSGELAERVAEALADPAMTVTPKLASRLLRALGEDEEGADVADADLAAARGRAILKARLVVRQNLPTLTRGGAARRDELDPALQAIVDASRRFHGRLEVPDEAIDALIAHVGTLPPDKPDPHTLLVLEAISACVPPDDRRNEELAALMWMALARTRGRGDAEERRRLFEIGCELHRLGAWVYSLEMLGNFAASSDDAQAYLEERQRQLGPVEADRVVAADALSLLTTLLPVDDRAAAREGVPGALFSPSRVAWCLRKRWIIVERIMAREAARGDVPGWVLSWLARRIGDIVELQSPPPVVDGMIAKAKKLFGLDLVAAITELHEKAAERDARLPARARDPRIAINHAHWVRRHGEGTSKDRFDACLKRALEARDILLAKRDERYAFDWQGRSFEALSLKGLCWEYRDLARVLMQRPDDHQGAPCPHDATIASLARAARDVLPDDIAGPEIEALHLVRHDRAEEALTVLTAHAKQRDRVATQDGKKALGLEMGAVTRAFDYLIEQGRKDAARSFLDGTGAVRVHSSGVAVRARLWAKLGETERAAADRRLASQLRAKGE